MMRSPLRGDGNSSSAAATCHKSSAGCTLSPKETPMPDAPDKFDIDDPVLPKWVKKGALELGRLSL